MASPMVESRVDPHKKAQYSLHISDQIADGEVGDYTSVRFNHKPAQTTASRNTKITSTSPNDYTLRIEDQKPSDGRDVFIFTGQKTVPKRSYILVFDPASQKATLEPLANTYTFNVSTKNGIDMSSTYPKIYPRKQKDDAQEPAPQEDIDDSRRDDVNITADAENPFDFRHFLSSGKDAKNGDESEYNRGTSSPDYRTGTGSAMNTPQLSARKPNTTTSTVPKTKAPVSAKAAPKAKKPTSTATVAKKPPPAVRLERRATTDPKAKAKSKLTAPAPAKPAKPTKKAAAQPPSSKIKSAEIVHSSDDESDADDDAPPPPSQEPTQTQSQQRSPSPQPPPSQQNQTHSHDAAYDSDEEAYDSDSAQSYDGGSGLGGLEIEFEDPDENASKPRGRQQQQRHPATAARLGYLNSPANGPISLASVASSVEGTPRTNRVKGRPGRGGIDDGVIDFDELGGGGGGGHSDVEEEDEDEEMEEQDVDERDDVDVEPIDIGPPAAAAAAQKGHDENDDADADADADGDGDGDDGDMEDLLYKEVMEGLAGGDSSEESEEE
ncbi:unnamed protein product [Periconia digitata]|uniref:Transcription elongation factor Eaf N-terminal domain-containing protein n=1 Tax=Periconia digitata TaxID=1303443 RepID=A0A9W4XJS5_9PLEO|nr:unnamed protein product [Periconia digitata]